MSAHPLAGKPAPKELLIDVNRLEEAFYEAKPDPADPNQLVSFGTSGHRGTSSNATFTEAHILAITQAICEYRHSQGITGPLFMGKDTHALSRPAERVALEVLAANGVETFIQATTASRRRRSFRAPSLRTTRVARRASPTASSSPRRTIRRPTAASNTICRTVVRPTPTSPTGFKTAPTNCCAAATEAFAASISKPPSRPPRRTRRTSSLPYVQDLANVIDLEAIRSAGVKIGVDPLGGASVAYWQPLAERYGLDITVVNPRCRPDVCVHDGGSRRQNPNGLLEPLCDGQPGKA